MLDIVRTDGISSARFGYDGVRIRRMANKSWGPVFAKVFSIKLRKRAQEKKFREVGGASRIVSFLSSCFQCLSLMSYMKSVVPLVLLGVIGFCSIQNHE